MFKTFIGSKTVKDPFKMTTEDKYAIGLVAGMEYVDGVMKDDTSWTSAVCIKDGATENIEVVAKDQVLLGDGDIFAAIQTVMGKILQQVSEVSITRINIATPQVLTEALNNDLSKVSAVRLCGCATQSLLPFVNIPDEVNAKLKGDICLLDGGYEYSRDAGANSPIKPLNTTEVLQCIDDITASSVSNVAVTGVYSPDCAEQEYQVGELFKMKNPDLNVTLSHEVVNEIGLLERENTTILNAGLEDSFKKLALAYKAVLEKVITGPQIPIYFVQNDGSLVSGGTLNSLEMEDLHFPFPVKSFFGVEASTMNSCIVLEKDLKDCMVISIDGTTSTAGIVKDGDVEFQTPIIDVAGFPIYKHAVTSITHKIGMFSIVHNSGSVDLSIGPDSVAKTTESFALGGSVLTVFDVAVKQGLIAIGDPNLVNLDDDAITAIMTKFTVMIGLLIESAKESAEDLPVVIVGVGNVMISETPPGALELIKPPNAEVANAIGAAALSETSLHFATTEYSPKTDPSEYLTHERHVFRQPKPRPRVQPSLKSQKQRSTKDDPHIDPDSHEWWLSELDLEYISVGAGILGSGGGGSPQLGKLMAIDQLDKGKKIRVKTADWMSDDGLAVITAIMGSPGVLIEKYPNGAEGVESIDLMKDLYNCGYDITDGSLKWKPAGTVVQNTESGVTYVEDYPTVYNSPIASDPKFEAVMLIESGGLNTMQSLVVGAQMDLPVYDCDGQGRSVPNLDMIGPIMYGTPLYPCTLSGSKGQRVVALTSKTSKDVEEFFRIQTTKMGYFTAISFPPLKKDVVSNTMVHFTVSKAWRLGKAIAEAQGGDPIQKILDSENGIILIQGKVTSLSQENVEGFIVGRYVVSDGSKSVTIDYQNENLVAWSGPEGDPDSNDKVLAVTPDLICIVDSNGHPLNAEVLYFGVQLTVIAAPCSPLLKSETALQYIGPRAVGYNFDYKPIGGNPKYKPAEPVSPRKKQPRN